MQYLLLALIYYLVVWKTIKPVLSDKIKSSNNNIFLVKGDDIINEDGRNPTVLGNFFSNTVKNLNITEYSGTHPRTDKVSSPDLEAIVEHSNHPRKHYTGEHLNFKKS